jgi:hypothetical protein
MLRTDEVHFSAIEQYPSMGRPLDLGEQLHQRRFAGAVFTGDHMHFAGEDVQIDVIDGYHPGKALRNIDELEEWSLLWRRHIRLPLH